MGTTALIRAVIVYWVTLASATPTFTAALSAPILPTAYTANWILFDTPDNTTIPPYNATLPAGSYSFGTTYYDWSKQAMVEVYYDKCIDIFPSAGNNYSCMFLNVNASTFLTRSFANGTNSCCLFETPWYPPPPNFLHQDGISFAGVTHKMSVLPINWWNIPVPPPAGPFSYGFYPAQWTQLLLHNQEANVAAHMPKVQVEGVEEHKGGETVGVPAGFSFRSIIGFTLQMFYDVRAGPNSSVFDIPQLCNSAPSCNFGGGSAIPSNEATPPNVSPSISLSRRPL